MVHTVSYLDASRYTHSSRLTWDQCYETSYLDAFIIALCCVVVSLSTERVVGGEGGTQHGRSMSYVDTT